MFLFWTIRKLRQIGVPWPVIGAALAIMFVYFLLIVFAFGRTS